MAEARLNWRATLDAFFQARVIAMLFLGFSAGLPLLLIFSSLSLWLREAGLERATVTYFAWAALGYSFKFVWAPLVDRLRVPVLTASLGRRRSWMLLAQLSVMAAIVGIALQDPADGEMTVRIVAACAVLLGFSSATQDIVIDAFRIESAEEDLQALLSATYVAGYRIGLLVAGAGALFLASYLGSEMGAYDYGAWRSAYLVMAGCMLIGVTTTLLVPEPDVDDNPEFVASDVSVRFVMLFVFCAMTFVGVFVLFGTYAFDATGPLMGFLREALRLGLALAAAAMVAVFLIRIEFIDRDVVFDTYIVPVRDFFARYGVRIAWLLLALVGFYRISDIVLGVIANVFYQDLGFTKIQIAEIVKTFGLFMTIAGGFLGGVLSVRYGVMRVLFLGALLTVLTNLSFIVLAEVGYNVPLLYLVISMDNLTAGLASAAFIAFLSSLTNIKFTAVQYAIFSSLMTLLPKVIGGYSGTMVDSIGYSYFFLFASLLGIPVLLLVSMAMRRLEIKD